MIQKCMLLKLAKHLIAVGGIKMQAIYSYGITLNILRLWVKYQPKSKDMRIDSRSTVFFIACLFICLEGDQIMCLPRTILV